MFVLRVTNLSYKIKKRLREKDGITLFWMKHIKLRILNLKELKHFLNSKAKEDFL
jgi:hypothetical protein